MSYQLCRWYDPYPRLAFALKLLYLAPGAVQVKAARELQRFMEEHWETSQARKAIQEIKVTSRGKRWYDEDPETFQTVELLKNSPEFLKSRVADTLLEILSSDSASA
ncbi:MAG: hypothetical protein K0Q50_2848 [Vampirovibrio sp.]|nr:hypothetical protein [Vampirovibrio sp.]